MSFVEDIFARLEANATTPLLQELRDPKPASANARELLRMITAARAFLSRKGLKRGDRCALLANNSIRWIAMDLAIMAEGMIVVPLYARQAPAELVSMMKDCSPSLILCGDSGLFEEIRKNWSDGPPQYLLDDVFGAGLDSTTAVSREGVPFDSAQGGPTSHNSDPVAIIYTSGTSGDAKGVVLTAGNLTYMLGCTIASLDSMMDDSLMDGNSRQDRVFHYLPFAFAASHIALLTYLLRGSLVILNMDLTRLATEMPAVEADYFLNVPALLERTRKAVDGQLREKGGMALNLYNRGKASWERIQEGKSNPSDKIWLSIANAIVFSRIRKKIVGRRLRALICGSAPLAIETQLYFKMLGIPVLQVYGLTETTGICTMDNLEHVVPGRVGSAIPGIEIKIGENEEIMVRGPNIFPGYWNRPQDTEKALRNGWFHTGDQGEVDNAGNWRIVGRVKNLIILNSGHKFPVEPLEQELLQVLRGAQQVMLLGNGRGYLCAIVTGDVHGEAVRSALDSVNAHTPHYKQIHAFHISATPFSIDNGLLTANGKLKRELIADRFKPEIEEMYRATRAS